MSGVAGAVMLLSSSAPVSVVSINLGGGLGAADGLVGLACPSLDWSNDGLPADDEEALLALAIRACRELGSGAA